MIRYKQMLAGKNLHLAFQPIGRLELASIIDSINPSRSSAMDEISMRLLRKLKSPLLPAIQHLVNLTITTTIYPDILKQTKVIPLLKKGKEETCTKSYRGVNLIPSLAKVIDRTLLIQLLKHIQGNNLIPHQHHGGVANHGTATALATLVDTWSHRMESGQDSAALIMDQSLAYDLVDHVILLEKLQAIGLDKYSIKLMQSYLDNRTQSVQVESFTSPPLHIGRRSVIQGSALSCVLYIVFTLDLPLIFDADSIRISHEEQTQEPRSLTYIDDNFVIVAETTTSTLQQSLDNAMDKVTDYMANNRLMLNPDKTQLMVISKKPDKKSEVQIAANPEPIKHKPQIKILGIEIDEKLSWRYYLQDGPQAITKQLKTRVNLLKLLKRSTEERQMRMLANGIFMSKLEYGAEIWASAPEYILKNLQSIQLEAARTVLGPRTKRWSKTTLLT